MRQTNHEPTAVSDAPRGWRVWRGLYYGWPMLAGASVAQAASWGILYYGFSVFLKPIQADTGWSRAALTGAFSLALLCSGVTGLAVGYVVDRAGPRRLMTLGSCAAALLLLALSRVGSLLAFYLVWAALGVTMATVLYEPVFALVAAWFERYRARALTLLTFVGGLASVIFVPLAAWLIRADGWRHALVLLALILAILTIPPHALLLRRRPQDLGLLPDGAPAPATPTAAPAASGVAPRDALRSTSFRWLSAAFCLAFLVNVAVTVHLIPYLTDRGYSSGFAASVAGAIGLLALPGRLVFTPLGDRVPRRFVAAAIFGVQTVALVVLVVVRSTPGVLAFVALFGAGFGAITPARAALVADLYGTAHFGKINGTLALVITAARALAPVGAGLLYAAFGRYDPVFVVLIALSLLASGAILLLEREPAAEVLADV